MSDDLISRQAVYDLIQSLTKWCVRSEDGKFNNVGLLYDDVMFGIYKLSPVNPQECVGSTQKHVGNALDMRCDDAISRDAVWEVMQELWGTSGELIDRLMALPPVNSQEQKTGHREYNDIYEHYLCGNCKTIVMDYDNYCPNCGYRMFEPQESENME